MEQGIVGFRSILSPRGERLLVFSPKPRTFVWIEMWIPPDRRKNGLAAVLVNHALNLWYGDHFIEFPPQIASFSEIAQSRKWRSLGPSQWFHGCQSFHTRVRPSASFSLPSPYREKTYLRCPSVRSFTNRLALKESIELVAITFANPGGYA